MNDGRLHTLQMARIPTIYNADMGLYVANNQRWAIAEVGAR
jgi:hypothetical protein